MSYNVSALADYTRQEKFPLITKAMFEGKSLQLADPHPGVKYQEAINGIDTEVNFQLGGQCEWNASGNTSFSQRVITVYEIDVMEQICPKELNKKYLAYSLKAGSKQDSMPFEQEYTELKAGGIGEQMEILAWQGDTTLAAIPANRNKRRANGWLKILDGETSTVIAATPTADITASNVMTIFKEIDTLIPAALINKPGFSAKCGWDVFKLLLAKITDLNLFHYVTDAAAAAGEITLPGTTLKIVALHGLSGTDNIVACEDVNLEYGFDMLNEEEEFKIFLFEDGSDAIRFKASWKSGFQVKKPYEIIRYKNS